MYASVISNLVTKFMLNRLFVPKRDISLNVPLNLNVTQVLLAEPMKRKKRIDPAVIKAREDRRRKKLEKTIRRLEKHAKQLKPIAELEVPSKVLEEYELRMKQLPPPTPEEEEAKAQLLREWSKIKSQEHKETVRTIDSLIRFQEKNLKSLRKRSEELYQKAIQIDPDLLPFSIKGPTLTPPIEGYEPPDGEYIDVTRKYDGEV